MDTDYENYLVAYMCQETDGKKLQIVDVTVRDPNLSDFILYKILENAKLKMTGVKDYDYLKMVRVKQGDKICKYYV